jgi:sortase (surface protein transpeptidase)
VINRAALAAAVAVAMAVAGCGSGSDSGSLPLLPARERPPATVTATATASAAATSTPTPKAVRRVAPPVRLVIPSIRVDAPVIRLGLDAKGALEVPKRFDVTGWWTGGSRPGEPGPAVIAGHVDSKTGAAVFYELPRLRKGDVVFVKRQDGSRARFVVQGSATYSKDRFPTARVYGATRRPTLRLITCSGEFDRSTGHYLDNTVVYATS